MKCWICNRAESEISEKTNLSEGFVGSEWSRIDFNKLDNINNAKEPLDPHLFENVRICPICFMIMESILRGAISKEQYLKND
tara:strand:- start:1620 stop:1865 length:246 start_codon:yes stop_codon:yes gene_type:complete